MVIAADDQIGLGVQGASQHTLIGGVFRDGLGDVGVTRHDQSVVFQEGDQLLDVLIADSVLVPDARLESEAAIAQPGTDFGEYGGRGDPKVPPSLNFVAVALLAELHGRCGYFPAHLRMRPVEGSIPRQYKVAEVLDLQAARDEARKRR